MSEEIIKILDDLGRRIGIAIDWSNQNIMPYVQELITRFIKYRTATAIIWIVFSIVLFVAGLIWLIKTIKYIKENDIEVFYDDGWWVLGLIFPPIIILISIVVIMCNSMGIAKNIYLPETVTYEYIQEQISNK